MSIHIQQISAFSDNYIWLIINNDKKQAIAIDTGDSEPVLNFLKNNNLELINVWITHHHNDHIGGVDELVKHFPNVQVFAHQNHGLNHLAKNLTLIDENDNLTAWQYSAKVWQTFGHTDSHLSFLLNVDKKIHVFCGDTLFSGGCGRVFTGTIEQLFDSFSRFNTLNEQTLFYPAHEYTLSNLKFAQVIEPNNENIRQKIQTCEQLRANNLPTLPTTLADERLINPFLRAVIEPSDEMIEQVKSRIDLANYDKLTVFAKLRELKNSF
ncbi:hydroxyacylglutathione hydrolase [Faucicola mancuniensis]|uniref:hydroxyacylglutathione hydrolase n=1 Tax=Faucicola mancuniensis TaxID=1309795 RepID=UPI0039775240